MSWVWLGTLVISAFKSLKWEVYGLSWATHQDPVQTKQKAKTIAQVVESLPKEQ